MLFSTSLVAFQKSTNNLDIDTTRNENYVILDYEENIEFIASRDTFTPADLDDNYLIQLHSFIEEYINDRNRDIEPEVRKEIQKSPPNSEMIKKSRYLHEPDSTSDG